MTGTWTVTAYGVGGTEFTYEVEAPDGDTAISRAYGRHGRRLGAGDLAEPLGLRQAHAVSSEFCESDPPGGPVRKEERCRTPRRL